MELEQKKKIVDQIISDLHKDILEKIKDMPQEFDGIEIRQFILDYYASHWNYGSFQKFEDKRNFRGKVYELWKHNNIHSAVFPVYEHTKRNK